MSNPNPPDTLAFATPPPAPRLLRALFFAALAAYAVFLAVHATSAAGGSDSSGYINSARLLAAGRLQAELRIPAEFGPRPMEDRIYFTPFGFQTFLDHAPLPPTYPVGLPLHLAAASKLLGWHWGPLLIEVGGALAALCLCYLTARELGLGHVSSAAGAAMLGACPIFIFTSLQPISDTLATTWILASVLPALRARRSTAWALVSGVAFAIAVMVRPTNAVVLPALLVLIGLDWRRLALFVSGGIPGALWLGFYNHTLYGGPLRSGYGAIGYTFNLAYIPGAFVDFAYWIALLFPAVILVLPLVLPFLREFRTRVHAALAVWFAAVILLFACFVYSHETWWSLRYILPAIPALIFAALLGLEALVRRFPAPRQRALLLAAPAVLGLWALAGSAYWTGKLGVYQVKVYEEAYAEASRTARDTFPPHSVVLSGATCGSLYTYTDFPILRYEALRPDSFAHFSSLAHGAGRAVCALIFDVEEKEALREHCPGDWQRIGTVKNLGLWRLIPTSGAKPPPSATAK